MALKDTWKPRVDGADDADSSAVNEIADAVISLEIKENEDAKQTQKYAQEAKDARDEAVKAKNDSQQIFEDVSYQRQAFNMEANAVKQEIDSKAEEVSQNAEKAQISESNAAISASNTKEFEANAYISETNAKESENKAKEYAESIKPSLLANALKGKANAVNAVRIDDISPIEHDIKLKVTSKNLLDISVDTRLTKQEDGSYINNTQITSTQLDNSLNLPYGTYTLSYDLACHIGNNVRIYVRLKGGDKKDEYMKSTGEYVHFETLITGEIIGWGFNYASVPQAGAITVKNLQLEEGTVATDYVPYDISGTKLKAYGGNLLDLTSPITFQRCRKNEDGTITCRVSGESGYCQLKTTSLNEVLQTLDGHKITFSMRSIPSDGYMSIVIFYTDGTYKEARSRIGINSCTLALNHQGKTVDRLQLRPLLRGIKFTDTTTIFRDIQLEIDGASKYMPYIAPIEYAANQAFIPSIYPSMTLISDTEGVNIKAEYNRDINKAFKELTNAIMSLGGNV